jgi:AcrR family transcriptional regulator
MGGAAPAKPTRKRTDHYHHGDLQRALLAEVLRTIHADGVEGLTLRTVGTRLGVSRSALYRHVADKQALAAVGREGFRTLREALVGAWERYGRGRAGFEAMASAHREFAVTHPAHYRVMFGRFVESCAKDPEFVAEAAAAFQVLVDSILEQQEAGLIRQDDPVLLARFVWSLVHVFAMLAIDGQFPAGDAYGEALSRYTTERLLAAIGSWDGIA